MSKASQLSKYTVEVSNLFTETQNLNAIASKANLLLKEMSYEHAISKLKQAKKASETVNKLIGELLIQLDYDEVPKN